MVHDRRLPLATLGRTETLAGAGWARGRTRGLSLATERRRGGAVDDGELGEGRDSRLRLQEDDHESAPEELASVLQGSDDLTFLGQEKGSVRFLGMLGVLAGR
jgi:hypothetical protein